MTTIEQAARELADTIGQECFTGVEGIASCYRTWRAAELIKAALTEQRKAAQPMIDELAKSLIECKLVAQTFMRISADLQCADEFMDLVDKALGDEHNGFGKRANEVLARYRAAAQPMEKSE